MGRRLTVLIAVAAVGLGILVPTAAARTGSPSLEPGLRLPAAPMIRVGSLLPGSGSFAQSMTAQSANWAGYDASGRGYRSVSATWTQPTVTPDKNTKSASAFWVGLDGDGSSSVEQCGTDADDLYGTTTYYAWCEMYPAPKFIVPDMTISPGDVMHGSVLTDGACDFTITLSDETTGVSKTFRQYNATDLGCSAEVIVEAPTDAASGKVLPLAGFGSVSFTDCEIDGAPLASAPWEQIAMVDPASGTTLATPSALGADGASFSVSRDLVTSAAPPTLTGFSPASGPVGTVVTLSGSGFDGATAVRFGGRPASFLMSGGSSITATVPAGAQSGPISVTTPSGTATSAGDFTLVAAAPTLTGFSPTSGPVGTVVELSGSGFSGATAVRFGGTPASCLVSGDTSITAIVPLAARSGPVAVTTPAGTATSAGPYTLTRLTAQLSLRLGGLRRGVLRRGRRLTVEARLTPGELAHSLLRLVLERRHDRRWYRVLVWTRTTGASGRASVSCRLRRRGAYRVRVTIAATAANTAAHSRWRRFTVR